MSKGGAGKVYFVLYLAVVLELLIIIVERDEAEEHLHQKQKAAEAIVRSILSQLQSGAGTEGINTRPQDEITIPENLQEIKDALKIDIKTNRKYTVEVGVTDIIAEVKRREGEDVEDYKDRLKKLTYLANVSDIEYQIFHSDSEDPNNAPDFPTDDEISKNKMTFDTPGQIIESTNGGKWTFKGKIHMKMDDKTTFENVMSQIENNQNLKSAFMHPTYLPPVEIGDVASMFKPKQGMNTGEEVFYYSDTLSLKSSGIPIGKESNKGIEKRVFVVNFEPPRTKGWYKLRFFSRTNRVLGVKRTPDGEKALEVADDAKVNIGTVAVKVGDLRKVQKSLKNELEAYGVPEWESLTAEGVDEFNTSLAKAKDKVIAESKENINQILSNINLYNYIAKLLTPGQYEDFGQNKGAIEFNIRVLTPEVKRAEPVVVADEDIFRFDGVEPSLYMTITPYQEGQNQIDGFVYEDQAMTKLVGKMTYKPLSATPPPPGGSREYVMTFDRELKGGSNGAESVYYVKLVHTLQQRQSAPKVVKMHIFPKDFESSNKEINNRIALNNFYCYKVIFQYTPSSGNKIKPDQFKIKFKRDHDASETIVTGYTAKSTDNLVYMPNTKSAYVKIVWQDPISQKEVTLYERNDITLKLTEPTLDKSGVQAASSPSKKDIFVSVSGLKLKDNNNYCEDMKSTYKAKVIKIESDLGTIVGQPGDLTINENIIDPFSFSVSGSFKRRQYVEGSAKVTLQLTIIGSNGATSTKIVVADLPVSVQM